MVRFMRKFLLGAFAAASIFSGSGIVAFASEAEFYRGIQGRWTGPGEIVAGKYKGTKFVCDFNGITQSSASGMSIDGSCRVGAFNQPMNASVSRTSRGISGKFLDGEAGEGMDVTGGRYSGSKLVVDVKRKDLNGVMVARLNGNNKLNITVSVKVEKQLIPVIGMTLDRVTKAADATVTGSLTKQAAQ